MQRRGFLKNSGMAGIGTLIGGRLSMASPSTDSHIEVLVNEPIGLISPNIYGHFIEHIGGVVYDGVWVGKNSAIPNTEGIRAALIEKLRQIHAPMVRWPGGCFADSYDWKDGVGPDRPRRTNFWIDEFDSSRQKSKSVRVYESNSFGTDEFLRFCKLIAAEPYLAVNVRSLPALEFDHWVEYCNSPAGSTSLAELRAKGGSVEPYNVTLWGVGNESWGCGGNFTPQDYASEFRRFTAWVPQYGTPLEYIASGPSDNDLNWTRGFFEKMFSMGDHSLSGWSVHHYAWNLSRGKTTDWLQAKGDSLQFEIVDWYEVFNQGFLIEKIIEEQWAAIGEYDEQHKIKLVIDEYGSWYRKGAEVSPESVLSQQVTIRDALFTAFTLDVFNRHADKVSMAACAQLINCLNALFLAHEDKFVVTPNFHVFDMYSDHQGGQSLRTEFSSPLAHYTRDGKAATFWGLNGSSSLKGKLLVMTVVNADASSPRETEIVLRGVGVASATAKILSGADIHAHNTFEHSQVSEPIAASVRHSDNRMYFTFPAASVTKLTITLF